MCGSFQHPAPGGTHQISSESEYDIPPAAFRTKRCSVYFGECGYRKSRGEHDGKKPSEYVKAIIRQHPNIIPEEKILNAIFNEIRDKQASKKNISSVEGIVIETTDEALNYCRHLTNNEIRLMTLQRIINRDPLGQGIPPSFVSIYNTWPPERQREMLEDCQGALCRALFNKNAADGFWYLFENTYQLIVEHPDDSVQSLFTKIQAIPNCIVRCPDFDALSLKYFISVVKDGVQQ